LTFPRFDPNKRPMPSARARKSNRAERGGLLRLIITVAIVAWVIRSFIFAPFSIPSGSMLPTLYIGDYVLVEKWPYGYSRYSFPFGFPPVQGRILSRLPHRGDVVVFRPPGDEAEDYIKRVVGLPGDVVEMKDGALVLNGKTVSRGAVHEVDVPVSANSPCRVVEGATPAVRATPTGRSCVFRGYSETLPNGVSYTVIDQINSPLADTFPATTVPPGHLFLMGDNRDDSLDSRFSEAEGGIGMVPLDHLVGRAAVLFWSTDGSSSYVKPWTWFSALRTERIGHTLSAHAR
jgi:signal peptidase I